MYFVEKSCHLSPLSPAVPSSQGQITRRPRETVPPSSDQIPSFTLPKFQARSRVGTCRAVGIDLAGFPRRLTGQDRPGADSMDESPLCWYRGKQFTTVVFVTLASPFTPMLPVPYFIKYRQGHINMLLWFSLPCDGLHHVTSSCWSRTTVSLLISASKRLLVALWHAQKLIGWFGK